MLSSILRAVLPLACVILLGGTAHARSGLTIEVAFREPASTFELLDQVSDWWPGYTDPTYAKFWADSARSMPDDVSWFRRYAELRNRHFDRTGQNDETAQENPGGLFTASAVLEADPVAHAFYRATTMDQALESLTGVLEPEEVEFLGDFYAHFEDRVAPLITDAGQLVESSLQKTTAELSRPEVVDYLQQVAEFIGVPGDVTFTALYVWWPDSEQITANPNGRYLILRMKPYDDESISSADVVVHEAVHALIAELPDATKMSLSDSLLGELPDVTNFTRRLAVVEEPVATVLGNIEFRRRFDPRRFAWSREWYGDPWADLLARLFYPVIMDAMASGSSFDEFVASEVAPQLRIGARSLGSGD